VSERAGLVTRVGERHLQLRLQGIDLRLERAVRLWQQAGQDPNDAFRGLYVSDEQASALLTRPLASGWGHATKLSPEIAAALDDQAERLAEELAKVEAIAAEQHQRLPLIHLQQAFGLGPFEIDALLIAIAPAIDLRYERLYGYLQDDVTKKRPTVNLALDLLAEPGVARLKLLPAFEAAAPLIRHHLVALRPPDKAAQPPLLAHTLHVDESLLHWLLGGYRPHSTLLQHLSVHQPPAEIPDAFIGADLADALAPLTLPDGAEPPIARFHGPDTDRQRAAAAAVARALNRMLMIVDLERATADGQLRSTQAVELALRDARLLDALPMLTGWDAVLVDDTTPPDLILTLTRFPGPLIVAGTRSWIPRATPRTRRIVEVAFPIPNYAQRCKLWAHYAAGDGDRIAPKVLDTLAGQFALTSGQIRDAVATARDAMAGEKTKERIGESANGGGDERAEKREGREAEEALFAAARAHSNPRLATLADKITPRYGWEDIILPDDQLALLHEIIDTVQGRPQVLDAWGLGIKLASSRGVTVLFSGPPGTGKTMAAQIIAGELGLDLYRIDLSTVVSKYIGETEKNIERIFREAEQSNAILFFDEADALFGKRSEVRDSHDRYANIEVSYLLQRMEAYDGVTILATNLRGNLDEAFTRRLQFAVAFPFPEADDRLRIWETLAPSAIPWANDIDFELLAERFKLAGGNIRNVLVSAAYLAAADGGVLTMGHLLHGTRRELQKMGRLVNESDLDWMANR
jgi:hypothetical protein